MLFFRKKNFAGLDIGTSSVKLVQLKESRENEYDYQIRNIQYSDRNDPTMSQLKEVMQELVKETKKLGDVISVGIQGISIVTRYLEIPHISPKELEVALPIEAKKFIPFPLEEMTITHSVLPTLSKDSKKMGITFVGIQKSRLSRIEKFFDEFGVKVKAYETPAASLALANKLSNNYRRGETLMILNVGTKYTNLAVCRDGGVYFARDFPLGGRDITKALMDAEYPEYSSAEVRKRTVDVFSRPDTYGQVRYIMEEWLREVVDSMDYFSNHLLDDYLEINRVFLVGGGSLMQGLSDFLSKKLNLPVMVDGDLPGKLENNSKEKDLERMSPMLKFAYSLALKCREDYS